MGQAGGNATLAVFVRARWEGAPRVLGAGSSPVQSAAAPLIRRPAKIQRRVGEVQADPQRVVSTTDPTAKPPGEPQRRNTAVPFAKPRRVFIARL